MASQNALRHGLRSREMIEAEREARALIRAIGSDDQPDTLHGDSDAEDWRIRVALELDGLELPD